MRKRADITRKKNKKIFARIEAAQIDELQKNSQKKDLPMSHLIRLAIKNFLIDK